MDPNQEQTVVENAAYCISSRRDGDFLHVRLAGRFAPGLLDDLRDKVFLYKSHYAVNASALAGVSAALAREFEETAVSFRSGGKRLVLVDPPKALVNLLTMGGRRSAVEIVHEEDQLRRGARGDEAEGAHAVRELERMRGEFQSNRNWQFADRRGCWICPYCAAVQEDVRFGSPLMVPSSALEKAYRHLWSRCPAFRPMAPRLRPLREMEEALRRANADQVVVRRGRMDRLESELASLKDRTQEMEDSVRRASERQRRLLPAKAPEVAGAEVDLVYRPAEVVSGDFYDFVPLDDDRIALLVGDVSGHGIEAGIVMGMAKKVLSIRLQDFQDPVEALTRTNDDVDRELGRLSFVTAFVAVYEPSSRVLTCVRAGHNPPLLHNPARQERTVELRPGGMGLGIVNASLFETSLEPMTVDVQPGDVLLMYTDGLIEASDPEGNQFGTDRVTQVLTASYGYPPGLVLSQLMGALDGFAGEAVSKDDITAVCVRFL